MIEDQAPIIPAEPAILGPTTTHAAKPRLNYPSQLGILLGFTGAGVIIGSILVMILWLVFTGGSMYTIERDMLSGKNTNAVRWIQLIASGIMFFVPAIAFALVVSRRPFQYLGYSKQLTQKQLLYVIAMAVVAMALSGALSELNQLVPVSKTMAVKFKKMEDDYNSQVVSIAVMKSFKDYLLVLSIIAIAPAIFEETLFRGGLQQLLTRWTKNVWVSVLITSILFSAVHISFYGFLPRMGLGIVLGLIFYYGKNIWLNILLHFINNGISVTVLYLSTKDGKIAKDAMDDSFPLYIGVVAIALLYVLFKKFKEESALLPEPSDAHLYTANYNPLY
ncbi:MAG: CPBP family intramembrane metalloprotease [Bacteroidota bacterium]|nr:CPBP family intramembrane metalloprotease [Bacteroidota bacterium]